MTKYFVDCRTLDELKKAYKAAAMKYHPDLGGDTATMQAVNAEYSERFEVLKRSQNAQAEEDTTGRTHATTEAPSDFIDIIDALLHMDGLTVELCSRWLWIGGDTMKNKEQLKACGCRWSSSKKLWSWHHAEDGARWHKTHYSMASIRTKYGSTTYTAAGDRRDTITA